MSNYVLCPLKRELVCLLIALPQNKILPLNPPPPKKKILVPGAATGIYTTKNSFLALFHVRESANENFLKLAPAHGNGLPRHSLTVKFSTEPIVIKC